MSTTPQRSLLLDAENLVWFFALYVVFASLPSDVYASGPGGSIKDTICKVAEIFQGQAGRNVASLAIIIVGFGALMGKISAGLCMMVCVGIAIIFGATPIVKLLTGNSAAACSASAGCQGGETTELGKVLGNAINMLTGTTAKAICTVAVIILGLGANFGKISWPLAIILSLGIAMVYGSFSIVKLLLGCSALTNNKGINI